MESLISVDSSSPLMQLCRAGLGQTELHHRAGGPFTSAACLGAPGTLAPLFCVIGNYQDLVEANSRLQGSFINCLRHTVCSTPIRECTPLARIVPAGLCVHGGQPGARVSV